MNDIETALPQALPVAEVTPDFDPSIPPSNGEEFLRYVRYEAQRCPDVVVANTINPRSYDNQQTVYAPQNDMDNRAPTQSSKAPSKHWRQTIISSFVDHRAAILRWRIKQGPIKINKYLATIPSYSDKCVWKNIIGGGRGDKLMGNGRENINNKVKTKDMIVRERVEDEEEGEGEGRLLPLISVVGPMTQAMLSSLLQYCNEWIPKDHLNPIQAQWMYGLLICLDRLMDGDMTAILRSLLRRLLAIRDNLSITDKDSIARVNVLVVILGHYFGQTDLLL